MFCWLKKQDCVRREDGQREREHLWAEARTKGGDERERRKRGEREDEAGAPPKPSGTVSLFDFVQNKLPPQNGMLSWNVKYCTNSRHIFN